MKSLISLPNGKPTASFRIVCSIVTIVPLWLMLSASTSADAQAASSPADWTQFHRDNMQRWNPYEALLGVNNLPPQLKWQNPDILFSNDVELVFPSPAVVNGVVYSQDFTGGMAAFNASSGARLWTSPFAPISSPAVANGLVYFGAYDSNFYALNASTGHAQWIYTTALRVDSSPAVVNGVVYFGAYDDNFYALNASSGALIWKYTTGAPIVLVEPAVANGVVYFGSEDGNLYALDATTGAKLWSFASGGGSPAVSNGVVYVGGFSHNFYAVSAGTGKLLWTFNAGCQPGTSPAVANGVVYFSSSDLNLYALNASSGAKLWSYSTGNDPPAVFNSPAVANGLVYLGLNGLSILDANTGALLWTTAFTGPNFESATSSSPTVVDGVVYIRYGLTGPGDQIPSGYTYAYAALSPGKADLFLRISPSTPTVHQGDLLTYAFPVWNLGPSNAVFEVLNTQVPTGTTFDYVRISGTPGLGTCSTPPYRKTGPIICNQNASMAPNTTWTVRLTVKVTAPAGSTITANAATMADTPDPNLANNMASVSVKVQ